MLDAVKFELRIDLAEGETLPQDFHKKMQKRLVSFVENRCGRKVDVKVVKNESDQVPI